MVDFKLISKEIRKCPGKCPGKYPVLTRGTLSIILIGMVRNSKHYDLIVKKFETNQIYFLFDKPMTGTALVYVS